MKDDTKRIIITLVLFIVIFWGSPYLLGFPAYDAAVRAIELLSAVLASGCYYVGSRKWIDSLDFSIRLMLKMNPRAFYESTQCTTCVTYRFLL